MDFGKKTLIGFLRRKSLYRFNTKLLKRAQAAMGTGCYDSMDANGEDVFLRQMLPHLPPNPVILDVGANQGDYASSIMKLRPDAIVHAFEPNQRVFVGLEQRAKEQGFTAHNLACGSDAGDGKLYDIETEGSGGAASRSIEVVSQLWQKEPIIHDIKIVCLDQFLQNQQIQPVSFVKIDVEGYEMDVLRSMQSTIASGQVDIIAFEFNVMNLVTRTFLRDFHDFLHGWRFYRILPDGLAFMGAYDPASWEIFAWQNIVAVRPTSSFAP